MKCSAKIAQLLIEGKKGVDLQAAVQEFDKNHVPTTRKCPKTVRVYTLVYTFMGREVRK
jgi:hypothetical protein